MRPCRLVLLCGLMIAACAPAPSPDSGMPAGPVVLIAVTGLKANNPVLAGLPDVALEGEVLATGMGATAALEFLDGRDAIAQLRYPRDPLAWAQASGWTMRVDLMDTSLRSEPEWVHSDTDWNFVDHFPAPADVDLHVVIVPAASLGDTALSSLLAERIVVIAGIPEAPARDRRRTVGGDPDEILEKLIVPVFARGLDLQLENDCTLNDVLAPLRGAARPERESRIAHWWNAHGGGVLVDDGSQIAVGGSGREPVLVGREDPSAAASSVAAATPHGDLLVLIRGSEGADLTALEILTGAQASWEGWGLEPIDTVQHPSHRYIQLDLAAEPEGDGILIEDAGTQVVEVRLLAALEDAPPIGAPVRDAGNGRWIGLNGIRLSPWSRDFWRLSRDVEFSAEEWWQNSGAGIYLLWVDEGEDPPAPIELGD